MAWTTPRTWVAGEKPSAATMNLHIRDNLAWLRDSVRTGPAASPAAAADTSTFVDVTFSSEMSAVPVVVVSILTAVPAAPYTYWLTNITVNGFRLNVRRAGAALGAANWNYTATVV